jgi:hypothetical protein
VQTVSGSSLSTRDLTIDWLRGLAMTCVIVNHSKLSSFLNWFSYERFWVVTAAEVFVVLSGVVLGAVYGRRLARHGWRPVVRGLSRRALLLYVSFVAVTLSVPALAGLGIDVTPLIGSDVDAPIVALAWQPMTVTAWRDVLLMRAGPWTFQIVGLYVWLVAAALPALWLLHRSGWRLLLAVSWGIYLWYRIQPHALTPAGFETTFPVLAWQLLFVHGIVIGHNRNRIRSVVAELPAVVPASAVLLMVAFAAFAFANPWTEGPAWLRLSLVSPERFSELYGRYFALSGLGVGRLINLAVGLAVFYGLLTRYWALARPFQAVFVTLGQRSLGAFVLHVYGVLLVARLPRPESVVGNTLVQVMLVCTIAALLNISQLLRDRMHAPEPATALAA